MCALDTEFSPVRGPVADPQVVKTTLVEQSLYLRDFLHTGSRIADDYYISFFHRLKLQWHHHPDRCSATASAALIVAFVVALYSQIVALDQRSSAFTCMCVCVCARLLQAVASLVCTTPSTRDVIRQSGTALERRSLSKHRVLGRCTYDDL